MCVRAFAHALVSACTCDMHVCARVCVDTCVHAFGVLCRLSKSAVCLRVCACLFVLVRLCECLHV